MKEKTEAKSMEPVSLFYEKRAQLLLKNLRARILMHATARIGLLRWLLRCG